MEAEKASKTNNNKILHHFIKQLTNKPCSINVPNKDKNGKPLLNENDQLCRSAEHFKELLNSKLSESPPNFNNEQPTTPLSISCEDFTINKLKLSVENLKTEKHQVLMKSRVRCLSQ
jgi:hypothetical protein